MWGGILCPWRGESSSASRETLGGAKPGPQGAHSSCDPQGLGARDALGPEERSADLGLCRVGPETEVRLNAVKLVCPAGPVAPPSWASVAHLYPKGAV